MIQAWILLGDLSASMLWWTFEPIGAHYIPPLTFDQRWIYLKHEQGFHDMTFLAGFCLGWIKKKQVVLYFSTLSDIFSLYVSCVTKYNSKYKECNLKFVLNPNFGKHVNVELTYVCSRDGHGVIVWQYVKIPTLKELPVSFGGGVFPD